MNVSWKNTFRLALDARHQFDLRGILSGLFSPLQNQWMNKAQATQVLQESKFGSHFFPWVFTLRLNPKQAEHVSKHVGNTILLSNQYHLPLASMKVHDIFTWDPREEAMGTLGTDDPNHPYLKWMLDSDFHYAISGTLTALHKYQDSSFSKFVRTPKEIKNEFSIRGWTDIVGFQTRNPLHRSHVAIIQAAAKQISPDCGILLHPVIGPTQEVDIDAATRMRCYQALLQPGILEPEKTLLRVLPLAMRMAGPKEAAMHAMIRRNVGCTHFIVGRDHAGPSYQKQNGDKFYQPLEAQEYCLRHEDKLGIRIMPLEEFAYHSFQKVYAPISQVPEKEQLSISGTKLRKLLAENGDIPEWFSYPSVTKILRERAIANEIYKTGLCFYVVGRSGSGKTTLVEEVRAKLLERGFLRPIVILDGDEMRTHISPEAGFTRIDRSRHVRRIGYVASLLVKSGATVLVSNIAPFDEDREYNRSQIVNYSQVFCNIPSDICRKRDPKGIYGDSIQGEKKGDERVDTFEEPNKNEFEINQQNWEETIQGMIRTIEKHFSS
jgi:sulfate adenylyltransferase